MKKKSMMLYGLLLSVASSAYSAYPDDLKIISWNTMLLPQSAFPNYGQLERAYHIANAPLLENQDVVVLQEMFDNYSADKLLTYLKEYFPHQTPVIGRGARGWTRSEGRSSLMFEDGGVAIVSKWPIVEKSQYIYYTMGCGDDFFSSKGFAYVKIDVNGQYYHLLGTHLQSVTTWGCGAFNGHAAVRQAQLHEINEWIRNKFIPTDEVVLIAGDFNINRYNFNEYHNMLDTLGSAEPYYIGLPYSFDTKNNGMAYERYGARNGDPEEYLDYIFVEKDHRQPSFWHNLVIDPPSEQWTVRDASTKRTYAYTDYSDHYPVMAFAMADINTPTHPFVPQHGSYRQVSLQNMGNGKWVRADRASDGWLKTDALRPSSLALFNLSNNFSMRDNGCIRTGEYIRIERADRPGWFWTWWSGLESSQYAYYTMQGAFNASPELRLINQSSAPNTCLQNGDVVALQDWARASDYYLTSWLGGAYHEWLFLWPSHIGPSEQFRVRFEPAPAPVDWGHQLHYRADALQPA